jgi:hypothetical protein
LALGPRIVHSTSSHRQAADGINLIVAILHNRVRPTPCHRDIAECGVVSQTIDGNEAVGNIGIS